MQHNPTPVDLVLAPRPSGSTLTQWLYSEIRRAIVEGRLRRGTALPPSRVLAEHYTISRRIVVNVFEQLQDEGYLEARVGSGTRISRHIPEDFLASVELARTSLAAHSPVFTRRPARPFYPVQPLVSEFPIDVWSRLEARSLRRLSTLDLASADPAGEVELRTAIADYLSGSRGFTCSPDHVVITTGTNNSLDLLARLLIRPRDRFFMEDPGYKDAAEIFERAGAKVIPLAVDEFGVQLPTNASSRPRAVYVTPAHQFPLGVALRLDRRIELLRWTRAADAFVLEDDYDSEFRFSGKPIPAIKGLAGAQNVFLLGTFNKALYPTLRVGYVVAPDRWVDPLLRLRRLLERYPAVLPQRTLAMFLAEGHYVRYLRRVRRLYSERLEILRESIAERLRGAISIPEIEAGLSIPGFLPPSIPAAQLVAIAEQYKLDLWPLTKCELSRSDLNGLLLGFAPFSEKELRAGVVALARAIDAIGKSPRRRAV